MDMTVAQRRERRAATKRRGHYVYFTGWLWEHEPVYHRRGEHVRVIGGRLDGEYETRTRCGIVAWRAHTGTPHHIVEMPAFHAEKIGRPCRKCFPERRTEAS